MILRILKIMILFIPLCVFIGCEDALVHEGEPVINRVRFSADCTESDVEGPYLGYNHNTLEIFFSTSNVNQEFELEFLIESPVIPDYEIPVVLREPVFAVAQVEPGRAVGIVKAFYILHTSCYSDGPYEISIAVKDANGDTGYFNTFFSVYSSPKAGDCGCVSQCGPCSAIRFTKGDRCTCGCPLYGEKCNE